MRCAARSDCWKRAPSLTIELAPMSAIWHLADIVLCALHMSAFGGKADMAS